MTLSNEARLGWPLRVASPLLRQSVQGMFERDVKRLRSVIEAELAVAQGRFAGP